MAEVISTKLCSQLLLGDPYIFIYFGGHWVKDQGHIVKKVGVGKSSSSFILYIRLYSP